MKYLAGAYFVILFAIMGSYLVYSLPDNTQRLHVATADRLSETQQNAAAVWARDLDTGSQFVGYSLESRWIDGSGAVLGACVKHPLPQNGEAVIEMPPLPEELTAGLEVLLLDDKGDVRKSAVVPISTFNVNRVKVSEAQNEHSGRFFRSVVPAAFVFDHPNEVFFAVFEDGVPCRGRAVIEQTYGQKCDFPKTVSIHGIGRFKLTLSSPVDLKIMACDAEYYASYVPAEKPIHAVLDTPLLTPDRRPVVKVTPVGNMTDVTIDYFDEEAWIGRQVIPASKNGRAELELDYVFQEHPTILYARVSASAVGTTDSSQTFPIVASKTPLSEVDQAKAAAALLKTNPAYVMEADWMRALIKNQPKRAAMIRDYALGLAAGSHSPSIEMRVRTEKADAVHFEREKTEQKAVMNVVLAAWFGIGTLVCLIFAVRNGMERRRKWRALLASGRAEAGVVPEQTSGIMIFCLFLLLIGFMVSLYFVMQII